MFKKVRVTIDNEKWEFWDEGFNKGGTSKKDVSYLIKVVQILEESLQQAKGELSLFNIT